MVSISDYGCICASGNNISDIMDTIDSGNPIGVRIHNTRFHEQVACIDIEENGIEKILKMCKLAFSQLKQETINKINDNTLIVFATCCGEFQTIKNTSFRTPSETSTLIASFLGLRGCDATFVNACSASSTAIDACKRLIDLDYYENALIISYDIISDQVFAGFKSVGAMSESFCSQEKMNGMSLGEAAVTLFIEKGYNKNFIVGTGITNDAYHMISPNPDGIQKNLSMKLAIGDGCLPDYINMHSTGTIKNEQSELKAIELTFGNNIPNLERTKFITGHCLGAAGALESIISLQRLTRFKRTMSNTFAFGGTNASIIFSNDIHDGKRIELKQKLSKTSYSNVVYDHSVDDEIISLGNNPIMYRKCSIEGKLVSVSLEMTIRNLSIFSKEKSAHILVGDIGAKRTIYEFSKLIDTGGIENASPFIFPNTVWNSPQGHALIRTGITGYNVTIMDCNDLIPDMIAESILSEGLVDNVFISELSELNGVMSCMTRIVS